MQARILTELNRPLSGSIIALMYIILGLTDMVLSQAAFALGIQEGNPILSWLLSYGLFIPSKIALTALVATLIVFLYTHPKVRRIAGAAVIIMTAVDLYHIWSLSVMLH